MRKIMKDLESSPKGKFSEIAHSYSQLSSIQQSADQVLIKKLKIREDEDILDLGCGLGQLTAEIRKIIKIHKVKKICIFGLSFKDATPVTFLSPSIKLLSKLTKLKLEISAYDKYVVRSNDNAFKNENLNITEK